MKMIMTKKTLWLALAAVLVGAPVFGNEVTIYQEGSNNDGTITQAPPVADTDVLVGSIYQSGTYNTAAINQTEASLGSSAQITQEGSNNMGTVNQGPPTGVAAELTGSIYQSGTNNVAAVNQTDAWLGSSAQITQVNASNNSAAINQSGLINQASIYQDSSPYSTAQIDQSGGGDVATINQNHAVSSTAYISQPVDVTDGSNDAVISQSSVSNADAVITQCLVCNGFSATITQENGNDLVASINQSAPYVSNAEIYQTGAYNTANINQAQNYNTASITQMGIGSAGNWNSATISQTSPSNTASIFQTGGGGNVANIAQ